MIQINALGKPEIVLNGDSLIEITAKKNKALLLFLAVERKQFERNKLAALFWGDFNLLTSQNSLRTAVHDLRKKLGQDHIPSDRTWLSLKNYSTDLDRVRDLTLNLHEPIHTPALEAALATYRGEFLENFSLEDNVFFEDWLTSQRTKYRKNLQSVLILLISSYYDAGEIDKGLKLTHRLQTQFPEEEQSYLLKMRLFIKAGWHQNAIQEYKRYQMFKGKTNLFSTEIEHLFRSIVDKPVALKSAPLPNFPTPYISRQPEEQRLLELLQDPAHSLITVIGIGGMGKSRLAIQMGRQVQDQFADGVYFVSLKDFTPTSAESCNDGLSRIIWKALRINFDAQTNIKENLFETLQGIQLLLILDNVETNPYISLYLGDLLSAVPNLRIITTSRERLKIYGETLVQVSGLDFPTWNQIKDPPDPQFLSTFASIRLFVDRAGRIFSSFTLNDQNCNDVAKLCMMLGGSPLGIEVAAIHLRTKSIKDIVSTVLDPEWAQTTTQEHQIDKSLYAILESTWLKLTPDIQSMLGACTVFKDGFTGPAFRTVTGIDEPTVDSLLERSLDESLLESNGAGRFDIHPILRSFIAQKGWKRDKEIIEKHYRYYLELLITNEDTSLEDETKALQLYADEQNIQLAWERALAHDEMQLIQQASYSLTSFLLRIGRVEYGRNLLAASIETLQARNVTSPLHQKSMCYIWLGLSQLEEMLGNLGEAQRLTNMAFERAAELESDPFLLAWVYLRRARAVYLAKNIEQEIIEVKTALHYAHQADAPRLLLLGIATLALCYVKRSQYDEAITLFNEVKTSMAQNKNSHSMAEMLQYMGLFHVIHGEFTESIQARLESLELFQKYSNMAAEIVTTVGLGESHKFMGDFTSAKRNLQHSIHLHSSLHLVRYQIKALGSLAVIALWEGDAESAFQLIQEIKLIRPHKQLDSLPNINILLGQILLAMGRNNEAAAQLSEAAYLIPIGHPDSPYLLSAQIDLALAQNDANSAFQLAHKVLPHLEELRYQGIDDVFTVFASCYLALQGRDEECAQTIKRIALDELTRLRKNAATQQEQDNLLNIPARRMFALLEQDDHKNTPPQPAASGMNLHLIRA